jgi:ParB/RepB/Spo0J family partition protein
MVNYVTKMMSMDDIRVDVEFNCRGEEVTPSSVFDLAQDIKKNGLLQPVTVGPVEADGKRLLIAGYRRYAAHKVLKRDEIFVSVRDDFTDHNTLLLMNLRENVQRTDLNIVQEAKALDRLIHLGLSEEKIAAELNKSRGWVQLRVMVRALPEELYPHILDNTFSQTNVRELYTSMLKKSREDFINDVKWLKNKKAIGKKGASLKDKEKVAEPATGLKKRTPEELFLLQGRIHRMFEMGHPIAVVLGWAAGAIASKDMENMLQQHCQDNDLVYEEPASE